MDLRKYIGEATEYDKKAMLEEKKPKSWCKSVSAFANGKGGVYTDSNGNSYEYLYYIDVIATAYGYSAGSVTATGKKVAKGMMARLLFFLRSPQALKHRITM